MPEYKLAVIQSESKLQKLVFVDFVDNLYEDEKALITGQFQYYIPWRVVWNENLLSTACRIVFGASMTAAGGCSLNSLLAKGVNSMNKLVEIVIRWMTHICALHTDIHKMYNAVLLLNVFWRYQIYFWLITSMWNGRHIEGSSRH